MHHRRARASFLFPLTTAVLIVTVLVSTGLLRSAADIRVQSQPASEGRPITPAGSLVMDATTRQPAVGAVPVAFGRSPDKTGPERLGRHLIAGNRGYGVAVRSATNRGQ